MIITATVLVLASASGSLAASLEGAAVEAAATVDAFHAALHRGDTAGAAKLIADEALIFESGEVEHGKAEYAAHHLAADAVFSKAVESRVLRRSGGVAGDLSWVASEARTTGTYKGKAIDSATTETMLLRRTAEGWRIVHVHWSSGR